jgi:hypothetical protein
MLSRHGPSTTVPDPGAFPLSRVVVPPGRELAPSLTRPTSTRTSPSPRGVPSQPPLLRAFSHDTAAPFKNSPLVPRGKVSPHTSARLMSVQEPPPHPGHHRTTPGAGAPLPSLEWAEASPPFPPYPVSSILAQLFHQVGPPLNDLPSSLSCRAWLRSSPTTKAHRSHRRHRAPPPEPPHRRHTRRCPHGPLLLAQRTPRSTLVPQPPPMHLLVGRLAAGGRATTNA